MLLTKLKERGARLAYAVHALEHGWSRAVLVHHLEACTVERQGKALTNFAERLPKPQSDLARESLKDPYRFDFLGIGDEASELELEGALVQHITRFLLELGAGFAFVGRQVHLEIGGEDFFLDLLFYHLRLRAYVVIELKATDAGEARGSAQGKAPMTAPLTQGALDLDEPLRVRALHEGHRAYLPWHRERVFKASRDGATL